MDQILNSLHYIKPEISAAIALSVLVIIDLIMGKNKKYLSIVMILGLLATTYFIIEQFGNSSFAFNSDSSKFGLLAVDSFGSFFKLLIILSSLIVVLFSITSYEIKKAKERLG